ncbi:MAG: hypothetical protein ABMB14_18925, partial [Myxococcota bacterium]
ELVFTATSQFVWMTLLPSSSHGRGKTFAVAMTATSVFRAIGAALAFPVVVESARPGLAMAALALPALAVALPAGPVWRAFRAAGGVR